MENALKPGTRPSKPGVFVFKKFINYLNKAKIA
jgi:hypothetical protein